MFIILPSLQLSDEQLPPDTPLVSTTANKTKFHQMLLDLVGWIAANLLPCYILSGKIICKWVVSANRPFRTHRRSLRRQVALGVFNPCTIRPHSRPTNLLVRISVG